MTGAVTVGAIALLAASSWALGSIATRSIPWPELRSYERLALRITAGLGLVALLLSFLALAGWLSHALWVLVCLAGAGVVQALRRTPSSAPPRTVQTVRHARVLGAAVVLCAALACVGTIAPVTDDDALAFVLPCARHIVETGALRVWPDQARSMFPQAQAVLVAWMLQVGGDRTGAVTGLQFLLCLGVVSALARRVCARAEHVLPAVVIALGSPVVAFQVASAKEDLFLVAASAATAFCLSGDRGRAELAAAGLFAGIAAGAKYSGLGVAIAAVAWVCIVCREGRVNAAVTVAATAALSGGLWYALNLWRFGNPVAPLLFGAAGTSFDAGVARDFVDGFGAGRSPLAFVLAPLRIFTEPSLFCGRANLYNPLAYAALVGAFAPQALRRSAPLYFIAAVLYVGWFFGLQNARLLLPAAVLLAPAAADALVPIVGRYRLLPMAAWAAAAVSLGVVAAVGTVRIVRYTADAPGYLERETQRYADIRWMNTHLDPARDRVGSAFKVIGYLTVPSLILDASRQIEMAQAELDDPVRFLAACRRQRITHLFGHPDTFDALGSRVRRVYENPSSRLGGERFFREPPSEATAVFEILAP